MSGTCGIVNPIHYNKSHTHKHEDYAKYEKNQSPDLLGRPQGLLLNEPQVKGSREDENQHCSRRGTNKSKDVFNGWDKNYKKVIKSKNHCCNQEMSYPAEWPFGKQQCTDR